MKLFAPLLWIGRKLKSDFDAAMIEIESETYDEYIEAFNDHEETDQVSRFDDELIDYITESELATMVLLMTKLKEKKHGLSE